MKEKYGFVYIWRDKGKDRYYIGRHWGTEDDGYICSSTWCRNSYRRRPWDFKRKILSRVYTNKDELINEEYKWLQLIKEKDLGKKYYNLRNCKCGSLDHNKLIEESKEKMRPTQFKLGQEPWNKGKKGIYTEELLNLWSHNRKGRPGYFKGKTQTQEAKDKVSIANKGKKAWNKGLSPSEETREKLRQHNLGKRPSEATRAKLREAQRIRRERERKEK